MHIIVNSTKLDSMAAAVVQIPPPFVYPPSLGVAPAAVDIADYHLRKCYYAALDEGRKLRSFNSERRLDIADSYE